MESNREKELLHVIWVIRNWSNNKGNMQSAADRIFKIAEYSKEVFEKHNLNSEK